MRHGHSVANQKKLIVSKVENGGGAYGLSDVGVEQVKRRLLLEQRLDESTVILCSDFKRASDTAEIVAQTLAVDTPVVSDPRLRERDFGDLELKHSRFYESVWDYDKNNPSHSEFCVESATSVAHRVLNCFLDLENHYNSRDILLISHGDTLQILQAVLQSKSPAEHRSIEHLETAEIRRLFVAMNFQRYRSAPARLRNKH